MNLVFVEFNLQSNRIEGRCVTGRYLLQILSIQTCNATQRNGGKKTFKRLLVLNYYEGGVFQRDA